MSPRNLPFAVLSALLILMAGCDRQSESTGQSAVAPAPSAAPTNRVDIPAPVRENLGITFAKVESRSVARTLRLPGRFELLPEGRREYRTMLAGQVEVLVRLHEVVAQGTPLFKLDSARWRELKQQLTEAEAAVERATAQVESIAPQRAALRIHEDALKEAVALFETRTRDLERLHAEVGGKAEDLATARAGLLRTRAEHAEVLSQNAGLEAAARLAKVELSAAAARLNLLEQTALRLCGTDVAPAAPQPESNRDRSAAWRGTDALEVRSATAGIVESLPLSTGAWAEEAALVMRVVQPQHVQLRARALQSRVARIADIRQGRIVPPAAESLEGAAGLEASVIPGTGLDASTRTLDVFALPRHSAPWARAGAAAFLELTTAGTAGPELAIPLSCVTRDGVTPVIFRRDPRDANKAIRMNADLGIDDGRWIVIRSGVLEGDEIVLNGAWQLMLATSGSAAKGGHFHADGTFHEGDK